MQNIIIRLATITDARALLDIYTPYVTDTAITFEYEPPALEEFIMRMQIIQQKYPYLVAECDGEILGYAYAGTFKARAAYDWSVETTIYIKKDQKQKGIGKALYRVLEQILKAQGIVNMNACIAYTEQEDDYLTNDSKFFHEKTGYQLVAHFHKCGYKYNRWYDMIWMEKMLGEHLEYQPKVVPITEIDIRSILC